MNDYEKHLENQIEKIEKTVKINVKMPGVIKKQVARKKIFVQIPFFTLL